MFSDGTTLVSNREFCIGTDYLPVLKNLAEAAGRLADSFERTANPLPKNSTILTHPDFREIWQLINNDQIRDLSSRAGIFTATTEAGIPSETALSQLEQTREFLTALANVSHAVTILGGNLGRSLKTTTQHLLTNLAHELIVAPFVVQTLQGCRTIRELWPSIQAPTQSSHTEKEVEFPAMPTETDPLAGHSMVAA